MWLCPNSRRVASQAAAARAKAAADRKAAEEDRVCAVPQDVHAAYRCIYVLYFLSSVVSAGGGGAARCRSCGGRRGAGDGGITKGCCRPGAAERIRGVRTACCTTWWCLVLLCGAVLRVSCFDVRRCDLHRVEDVWGGDLSRLVLPIRRAPALVVHMMCGDAHAGGGGCCGCECQSGCCSQGSGGQGMRRADVRVSW